MMNKMGVELGKPMNFATSQTKPGSGQVVRRVCFDFAGLLPLSHMSIPTNSNHLGKKWLLQRFNER